MKNVLGLTVCALSLLMFASPAQSKDAQANGTFDFSLGGATGVIVFDADSSDAGLVHGHLSLTATVGIGDPEGAGDAVSTNVAVEAQFDCLAVQDNVATMSGVITSSSVPQYVGQTVLLVVVDKLEGIKPPTDAFAWGVYQPTDPVVYGRLVAAQDYEYCPAADTESEFFPQCNTDPGTSLTWVATDYELCPYASDENPNPPCTTDPGAFTTGLSTTPNAVDCESFLLSSYSLNLIPRGGGNKVQVKHND